MKEIFQTKKEDICEAKEEGCSSLYCDAPDYVRRAIFLNDPKTQTLFNTVSRSIISNLASRSLESVDRDPHVISESNLPDFTCVKSAVSAFSRDELGSFFAQECVGTIGRVAKAISSKTAIREDLFIYDCLTRMSTQEEIIKAGGKIDGKELESTLEWYFSGDDPTRAPIFAPKYIDLAKLNVEGKQKSKRIYFSSQKYETSAPIEHIPPTITNRQKELLVLVAKGKSREETAKTLGTSLGILRFDIQRLFHRFNFNSVQQLIFHLIEEKLINPEEIADRQLIFSMRTLESRDLDIVKMITTPPFNIATDEQIAAELGVTCDTARHALSSIYSKVGVSSKIMVGVAYLAYKQNLLKIGNLN